MISCSTQALLFVKFNDNNNIKHIINDQSREGKLCVGGGFPPSV